MARIRTIKPEFWTSEQIVECSTTARLLFIGTWNFADDGGVFPDNIKQVKMRIFPGDYFKNEEIESWFKELVEHGLLVKFLCPKTNEPYYYITGWDRHQRIDKPSYKYPQFVERSSNGSRTVVDHSPPEGKGRDIEGGKEGEEGLNTNIYNMPDSKFAAHFPLFLEWLTRNCPQVTKLPEPITQKQFDTISRKYSEDVIKATMLAMDNYQGLLTKYRSVYKTFLAQVKFNLQPRP